MAYNEATAQRVRELISQNKPVEKKMFGGLTFTLQGNMAVGVNEDNLTVRVDPQRYEEILKQPHIQVRNLGGKPLKGWVSIAPAGFASDADLANWVKKSIEVTLALPPK